MKKFAKTPTTKNTILSDLNEILVGYILNNKKWFDTDAKSQHDKRTGEVTAEQYADVYGKSEAMAEEFIKWAKKHKYSGKIKNIWWTARPNSMTEAYGKPVDQKKNPSDLLIQFTSGPDRGFLGLSAKATKTKGDIGFKNPGLGTIEKSLNIKLSGIIEKDTAAVIKTFKLPASASQRKSAIRAKANIKKTTEELGQKTLTKLRDELLKKLSKMNKKQILDYIKDNWMDVGNSLPKYIKVTGMGNKAPYTAKAEDPNKNEKLDSLEKGPIKLQKNGISSILVTASGKNIMKMRFKWESQPFASSMKASGDPA